jgi:hypothetical protein
MSAPLIGLELPTEGVPRKTAAHTIPGASRPSTTFVSYTTLVWTQVWDSVPTPLSAKALTKSPSRNVGFGAGVFIGQVQESLEREDREMVAMLPLVRLAVQGDGRAGLAALWFGHPTVPNRG